MLTTKQLAVAGAATLALASGAVWLGTRARADETPASPAAAVAPTSNATAAPAPPSRTASLKVQRLARPAAQRPELLGAIRDVQKQRASSQSTASTPASTPQHRQGSDGDLDRDYVRSCMQELIPYLMECYEHARERDPAAQGTVIVDFTIEGEPGVGAVVGESNVDAEASTLSDPAMHECLQETMYALEIEPPSKGGVVRVRYPFTFAPK